MSLPLSRGAIVRTAPFALFMILLFARGNLPDNALPIDPRWIYGLTVLLVGGLMAWFWREYGELYRQNLPTLSEAALAAGVGVAVFLVWINLDMKPFRIGEATATYLPLDAQGHLQWSLVIVRWIGAALLTGTLLSVIITSLQRKRATTPDRPNEYLGRFYRLLENDSSNWISKMVRHLQAFQKRGVLIIYVVLFTVLGGLPVLFYLSTLGSHLIWTLALYFNHRFFKQPATGMAGIKAV